MDNYELICQIGKGNFGSISKIIRKADQKILVWKELDYGQMSEKEKQQIVSEVNILRELKHPNIVRYYDRIIDKKRSKIYIIMEYCEGGDLNQLIKRCKKTKDLIAEDIIWKIFTQIVLALHICHNRKEGKILHRDIKPSNVFLDGENNVKLGDFGLSRILSNESNFAYSHVGTPYYMSPEQIDDLRYNEKCDIWSLGCFLYEIITFCPPFEAKNHVMLAMRIKSGKVEKISSRYSEELWRVILWMLNVNPDNRPSVDELLNVPQVCLRLREKRLKENLAKMKIWEENLKKKEEELIIKEKELERKDKALKDKEETLNERERNINELSKKMSSISTNYTNSNNGNKNKNSNTINHNVDLGTLISYGNNNINKININNNIINSINTSEEFGSLTNAKNSFSKLSNLSNYDDISGYYFKNMSSEHSISQCNITTHNNSNTNINTNTNNNNNISEGISTASTPSRIYQKINTNRIIINEKENIPSSNYINKSNYDITTINQSTTFKRKSLNNSSNINKTNGSFKFDPSIYSDNLMSEDNLPPKSVNFTSTASSILHKYKNNIYSNESKGKKSYNKRAGTPKNSSNSNRNYATTAGNIIGIFPNSIITTRNNNINYINTHNTPQRSVSSLHCYYSKYLNSNQKSIQTSNSYKKKISSINSEIDRNNARTTSKGKKMKIPNK